MYYQLSTTSRNVPELRISLLLDNIVASSKNCQEVAHETLSKFGGPRKGFQVDSLKPDEPTSQWQTQSCSVRPCHHSPPSQGHKLCYPQDKSRYACRERALTFFTARGKAQELRQELNQAGDRRDRGYARKKIALKKVVANMTMGNDSESKPTGRVSAHLLVVVLSECTLELTSVSSLFQDVVACMQIQVLEIKKSERLPFLPFQELRADVKWSTCTW